ncbi:hypothetical protein WJX81_006139 [Elliptochloris bilobata]|uniref:AP2/ERF domain-containing protein n=1 Tax=Elliptochloris bilobata TaxID=381761 RepID=A0AAW1QJV2_9CHLO
MPDAAVSSDEDEDVVRAAPPRKRAKARRRQSTEGLRVSTSHYRGVTHHCRTGRWESHIWQDSKQLYLGGFDSEEQAALAYDLAAVKFRGRGASTNFDTSAFEQELAQLNEVTADEVVQMLRRQSKGFQKTSSVFRGVTKHQKGKWEGRIGQMVGKKYKYLGLFPTEMEAAQAYDREAIQRRHLAATTNFDFTEYPDLFSAAELAEAAQRGLLATGVGAPLAGAASSANGGASTQNGASPAAASGSPRLPELGFVGAPLGLGATTMWPPLDLDWLGLLGMDAGLSEPLPCAGTRTGAAHKPLRGAEGSPCLSAGFASWAAMQADAGGWPSEP